MRELAQASIRISLAEQSLYLLDTAMEERKFLISTSKYGAGCEAGSFKTPLGKHIVRAKIGASAPRGSVFVGRRRTQEICTSEVYEANPERDWVLTRILWLSGTEVGKNRLGSVDSMRRYIYIHGTPDTEHLGTPASIGCIRMHCADVIELFSSVPVGCPVVIVE